MIQIDFNGSPQKILEKIKNLREQKGREEETLSVIDKAIGCGHNFVINLFWEEATVYQHILMNELSKPQGSQDFKKKKKALLGMEAATLNAKFYVEKYDLIQWRSRLYRFLGRISDYKGDYKLSVEQYEKSLKFAKKDPDYVESGYPRWFEIEGFLSFALIMAGRSSEGVSLAKQIYKKYDQTQEGRDIRKKDYFTWAVWKTGVPVRTIGALIEKRITFNKKEVLGWLAEAERDLSFPKGKSTWGDKSFRFRKDEIASIKRTLERN